MDEIAIPVTRWNVGERFSEALSDAAASEAIVTSATQPMRKAMDDVFSELCTAIMDRMPETIDDEVRYRVDKIIEAMLQGDAELLGSFMAAGGHRTPTVRWDGSFRSGYWVDVRRKVVEANETLLMDERIADLAAERDTLAKSLSETRRDLSAARAELAEVKDALHWAGVRISAGGGATSPVRAPLDGCHDE